MRGDDEADLAAPGRVAPGGGGGDAGGRKGVMVVRVQPAVGHEVGVDDGVDEVGVDDVVEVGVHVVVGPAFSLVIRLWGMYMAMCMEMLSWF